MAVIAAFRDGWTALRENPVLLVAGFAFAVVSHVGDAGDLVGPPVLASAAGLVGFLLTPFVVGGLLGMGLEALEAPPTSLRRFVAAGRSYYVPFLVGIVVFVVAIFVAISATFPLTAIGFLGFAWLEGSVTQGGELSFWIAAAFVAVTVLAVLAVVFFLQFFGAAIVVEDEDGVGSLRRSAGVVRANLGSVLAFSVLWLAATNLLIPEFLLVDVVSEYELATYVPVEGALLEVAILPVGLALATVFSAYLYTVQTAYYCRLVGRTAALDGDRPAGSVAGPGNGTADRAVRRVDREDSTPSERGNAYADRA
jgi:hypothetical protein